MSSWGSWSKISKLKQVRVPYRSLRSLAQDLHEREARVTKKVRNKEINSQVRVRYRYGIIFKKDVQGTDCYGMLLGNVRSFHA